MSGVPASSEEMPAAAHPFSTATEAGRLCGQLVSSLAAAVYVCDAEGRVTLFNEAAAELWGRRPEIGKDLWCGSWKIFRPDGTALPLDSCPMAVALKEGRSVRGVEILVERPDGSRRRVLPCPEPIRDASGRMVGAINLLLDVTEREEAKRTQALLGAIIGSSDDAIISKTLDGVITSWNPGAERIFGYTAGETVGRSITMLIPEDRLPEEPEILARLRRGERIEHYETVRVTKSGRPVDILLTVSPVRGPDGELIGASKVARDITERKEAERTQALLAAIVESSDDAIISKSLDGVIMSWNRGAERVFGYTAGEIVGRPITTLIPEDRLPEEREILARLRRGERIEHYETVRVAKDGRLLNISLTVSPVRDSSGRLIGASKVARDVTAQKRAERALAESERNLRTVLSLLPVGVYSCDQEGRITFFNRRAAELWGREPDAEDTRFCACFRAYLPDGTFVPPDQTPMAVAVREGRSFRDMEAVVERPDGTRFHASVNIDPIRDEAGRVRGAINVFQDVTLQVAARETLENRQRALAEAVAARTAELEESHRRLRHSERMASLGTLSAGLGHDMGNLLLPVRVSLEALASAEIPEELRCEVERIRTSAQYLQQLANGLRMMAMDPERAGRAELLHLRAWWADAHLIVRNALPRTVVLEADVSEDVCVRITRPALTQVVFNLAQNAGEALRGRPDGRVRVTVRREGERALVCVEDNGPGMTQEVLNRCMEPFFTTKPRGISTGLGLVLVGGLVREAGGTVQIRSEPGKGTAFCLSFPLAGAGEESGRTRPRGCAVVDVQDRRLRSVIVAELRHLAFEIVSSAAGPGVDIVVSDRGPELPPEHLEARRVVLLGEAGGQPAHVDAIGRRPGPEAIRNALRTAAQKGCSMEATTG